MGWLDQYKQGGMIKRADGSYSQRGLWDNIRANKGSGKKPTKEMLKQEKKIRAEEKQFGGPDSSIINSKIKTGTKNQQFSNKNAATNSDFENYARIINQYQGRPNDTSYMYTKNTMRGNIPYTEQIFYNTGQNTQEGLPVSNVNRGQYVGQIPTDSVSYWRNMIERELPYKKYGGYLNQFQQGGGWVKQYEDRVNKWLGDPQGKARKDAENKSGNGDEMIDNIRHMSAGRYTAEAIANRTGNIPYISKPLGFIGANVMGLGHELGTYFTDPRWRDKNLGLGNFDRAKVITQEALEDSYNNFAGSVIGATNMTPEQKTQRIKYLSKNYIVPDGQGLDQKYSDNPTFVDPYSKKKYGGWLNRYQTGGYSTTGYKADSPDRNNPYNIIPSGRITMNNVPHPVMGIDNRGNAQYMVPGGEYQFPGDRVFEVPAMQHGGIIPTVNDAGDFKDGIWVPDLATIKQQAKKLGSKTVKTKSGSIIKFDENWNVKGVDDAPAMQHGGVPPIYVNSPNDPRYRAYQDSLQQYNNQQKFESIYKDLIIKHGPNDSRTLEDLHKQLDSLKNVYPFQQQYGPTFINKNGLKIRQRLNNIPPEQEVIVKKQWYSNKAGIPIDIKDVSPLYNEDGSPKYTQEMKQGGIPQRYKNMGFTHVGQKKSGDGQHKWKVLAKKGDSYKVVQGGYRGMQDFKQHHSEERKDRFWDRMGGRNSAKAKDPFSPLYWHKRFGTWEYGGAVPSSAMYQDGGSYVDGVYNPAAGIIDKLSRITPQQMQLMQMQARQNQSVIRPGAERRSAINKAGAIARNPITAAQYVLQGQPIPDYFEKGQRNVYNYATDVINPMTYVDAAKRTATLEHLRNMKGLQDLQGALFNTGMDAGVLIGLGSELRARPNILPVESPTAYQAGELSKVVPAHASNADELVDLWRIQERGARPMSELAAEGKLGPMFQNEKAIKHFKDREKYFGQWFTKDKADFDFYKADREFRDPEIIQLQVPKNRLVEFQNYDKSLSRAADREFVIPLEQQKLFTANQLPGSGNVAPYYPHSSIEKVKLPAGWQGPARTRKAAPLTSENAPYLTEVTPLTKEQEILKSFGLDPYKNINLKLFGFNRKPSVSLDRPLSQLEKEALLTKEDLLRANKDAQTFSQSLANRNKLQEFRPGKDFSVSNQEARFIDDPEAMRLYESYKLENDPSLSIEQYLGGSRGQYGARDYGDLNDVVLIDKHQPFTSNVPSKSAYTDAMHETTHSRSIRLGATDAEKKIASDAWSPMIKRNNFGMPEEEAFAVQNELRTDKLKDIKGDRIYTEKDIPEIKKGLQDMINEGHEYLHGTKVEDYNMSDLIKSLNKIGIGATVTAIATSQKKNQKYGGWLSNYQDGGIATINPVATTGTSIGTSTISGTPTINNNLLQLNQWANQSQNVTPSIAPNPSYRAKLVQDQVDYVMQNRAKNDTLPFAVVDKKSNNIAYYDRYGKIKGFEPVITGADNKDVDVAPSMKEFNAMYNVKGNKDYFNYLKATGQKITPAGIYTAHLRENQLDEPGNRAVHYVKNLLNPNREEQVRSHRIEAYGPQNKIFTLTDESGRGISKAIHGTGYEERIDALNNPNIRNKDLSNGCINVGGKTICFDALRSNSKVYILPEEKDDIVRYKKPSYLNIEKQAIAKKKNGGWLKNY